MVSYLRAPTFHRLAGVNCRAVRLPAGDGVRVPGRQLGGELVGAESGAEAGHLSERAGGGRKHLAGGGVKRSDQSQRRYFARGVLLEKLIALEIGGNTFRCQSNCFHQRAGNWLDIQPAIRFGTPIPGFRVSQNPRRRSPPPSETLRNASPCWHTAAWLQLAGGM